MAGTVGYNRILTLAAGLTAALLTISPIAAADPSASFNVAKCDKAIVGHGVPDWRQGSLAAGPVGIPRHPLSRMEKAPNGQLYTKMGLLVEGHSAVKVSVPARLRKRVFLYYGRIIDNHGQVTTSFFGAHGYTETEFQPCEDRLRTIWPGGVRIKGTGAVHLTVTVAGRAPMILRLGRPRVFQPTR
jgi:hypothetical protein